MVFTYSISPKPAFDRRMGAAGGGGSFEDTSDDPTVQRELQEFKANFDKESKQVEDIAKEVE